MVATFWRHPRSPTLLIGSPIGDVYRTRVLLPSGALTRQAELALLIAGWETIGQWENHETHKTIQLKETKT